MKIKKLVLSFAALAAFLVLSAATTNTKVQCGVSNAQIISYLQTCSHHHTACCVVDIPGTCNSKANIENCGTATVFVQDGIIVGHNDVGGICGN